MVLDTLGVQESRVYIRCTDKVVCIQRSRGGQNEGMRMGRKQRQQEMEDSCSMASVSFLMTTEVTRLPECLL